MDVNGFGHVILFGRFQKTDQILSGSVFMMMAGVACIGLLINTAGFQGSLRKHKPEGVAVRISSLTDLRDSGHMASDTTSKSVNAMDRSILNG